MAETVSNGALHAGDGASHSVRPAAPASWDWKLNLREFPKYPPIIPHEGEPTGLSFGELRIWVVCSADSGAIAYNVPLAWRITGTVDQDALTWSLNQIVARHEALRTCYRRVGDEIARCRVDEPLEIVSADLSGLPEAERERELQRRIQQEVRRPFDLSCDLMLHAALFSVDKQEHVVILTVHHIASDGPAMGVLLEELAHFYAAAVDGAAPTLPPPLMQCGDFTRWQKQALTEEVKQKQLAYWKKQLKDAPATLEVPSDRPQHAAEPFEGGVEYRVLSQPVSAEFKALSRRNGVTTFMGLLAAFHALLFRYSGQSDVVVGAAMTHRTREETSKSIGFFSNMMALRTRFEDDPTFRELLKRVRGVSLGAYAHQDVPFEAVVAELRPERAPGRNPLFQALLNYEDASWHELRLTGSHAVEFPVHNGTAKFDLSLCVVDHPQGFRLSLEYNSGLLCGETARRMLASLEKMVERAVADPDCRISQLPVLSDSEQHELLFKWNRTQLMYPENVCIHEAIEEQAKRTPEAIAVQFEAQSFTYGELNRRANALARHLAEIGVGPEVLVGICAERSLEMVVAMIAVLKAGGAYVPLDPAHPPQRNVDVVRDCGMRFLLTFHAKVETWDLPADLRVVGIEEWGLEECAGFEENLPPRAKACNLAYVIYTSGSTGRPKGVQIEHRAVLNFFSAMTQSEILTARDVLLAVTTPSFDISVFELLLPLSLGACVVIANREEVTDGRLLIKALERSGASVLQATPTSWKMLIACGWKGSSQLRGLCGGEPLPTGLANELRTRCGALFNMYGPTETCIWSSTHRVEVTDRGPIPIGYPIANTQFYVLDSQLSPVPQGVAGELYIGGAGLSRGYRNAEELTQERFVPNPFSDEAGTKMYRSGDLVRQRNDGSFEYLSRVDRQVKVRGHRIELGDVESAIRKYDRVRQVAVAAREDKSGGKQLVGYVVRTLCSGECEEEWATSLRASLREQLPEYMVPSAFVELQELPLTSSGKIDWKALPAPEGDRETVNYSGPRDAVEQRLVQVWEQSLHVQPLSISDNFFDLGGHSVLGATVLSRIEREFGKRLSLATLFQAPTIERLACILRQESWSSPWLVQVQAGDPSRTPFFFVHARMGYRALAAELGEDQPVYAVPYDKLYENQTERSMQEIAAELCEKIREVQPHGPYYLGGVCLAGRVAYAIAREMYRQGEQVALLTIFDASAPGYERKSKLAKLELKAGHVKWHLQRFVRGDPALKRAFVTEMRWHLTNLLWWVGNNFFRWMKRPLPESLRHQYRLTARAAITDREVSPYPGRVALFRPTERPRGRQDDPALGWKKIAAGGVELFEVPGDHKHVLLPPNVSTVAHQLRECLRRSA